MKDHEKAQLVNRLTAIAKEFGQSQQLRERISQEVLPHFNPEWDGLAQLDISERKELDRLRILINLPHTEDFMVAVNYEAAHQITRWGAEHDQGKEPQDWFWLLAYLSGKALAAFIKGDKDKGLHHIISSAAALLNWHRNVIGVNSQMRPGVDKGGSYRGMF